MKTHLRNFKLFKRRKENKKVATRGIQGQEKEEDSEFSCRHIPFEVRMQIARDK